MLSHSDNRHLTLVTISHLQSPDEVGLTGLLWLFLSYGYALYFAANMIGEGSELLLLVPSMAGLVGGVVLPLLGAVPDGGKSGVSVASYLRNELRIHGVFFINSHYSIQWSREHRTSSRDPIRWSWRLGWIHHHASDSSVGPIRLCW